MNSFGEIQRLLWPIPLGPGVGSKPLDGEGMISVVDPATEEAVTEIANGTRGRGLGSAHRPRKREMSSLTADMPSSSRPAAGLRDGGRVGRRHPPRLGRPPGRTRPLSPIDRQAGAACPLH